MHTFPFENALKASQVAQRFSAAFGSGHCDPGVLVIESHVRLPAGSLLLPLSVSLPLSHEQINKIIKKKRKEKKKY